MGRSINHQRWTEQSEAANIIKTNFYRRWCHFAALRSLSVIALDRTVWGYEKTCKFTHTANSSSFSRYSFLCNFFSFDKIYHPRKMSTAWKSSVENIKWKLRASAKLNKRAENFLERLTQAFTLCLHNFGGARFHRHAGIQLAIFLWFMQDCGADWSLNWRTRHHNNAHEKIILNGVVKLEP